MIVEVGDAVLVGVAVAVGVVGVAEGVVELPLALSPAIPGISSRYWPWASSRRPESWANTALPPLNAPASAKAAISRLPPPPRITLPPTDRQPYR
jgi:hypothetical protein